MVNVCHYKPTGDMLDEPALALFQQQWQLYRKFVDNNYFYHREVYGQLRRILVDEAGRPLWTALTPEEYETMAAHVRFHDFPENDLPVAFAGPRSRVRPCEGIVRRADGPLPDVLFSGVSQTTGRWPIGSLMLGEPIRSYRCPSPPKER